MPTLVSSAQITITDTQDYIFTGNTAPANPIANLTTWIDTSTTPPQHKVWDGSAWVIVNEVKIGGRNYLTNAKRLAIYNTGGFVDTYALNPNHPETPHGFYIVNNQTRTRVFRVPNVITENGEWTLSFEMRGSQDGSGHVKVDICDIGQTTFYTTPDNDWARFSMTVNVDNHTDSLSDFIDFVPSWSYIYIRYVKVEKGNKATDWTLAPEDLDQAINDAQTAADNANNVLTEIASDSKLNPLEKQDTKKEWDIIVGEKPKLDASAAEFGVSSDDYGNAYDVLNTYITPLLSNLTTTSDIVGTEFRSKFKAYYDAKIDLLNAIASKGKLNDQVLQMPGNAKKFMNVGSYNNEATVTGYLVITSPITYDRMIQLSLSGFQYLLGSNIGKGNYKVDISTFYSGATFYSSTHTQIGYVRIPKIQVAISSGKVVFILGLANTVWSYPKINIDQVIIGHGGSLDSWREGWVFEVKTDISSYTLLTDVPGSNPVGILTDMVADGILDPVEKKRVSQEWEGIKSEYPNILSQATALSVTTSSFTGAYNTLSTYITPLLSDMTINSSITRSAFIDNFKAYYEAKAALQKAVSDKLKENTDNIQIGGRNFLRNSSNFNPAAAWNGGIGDNGGGYTIDTNVTYNGKPTLKTVLGTGLIHSWLKLENNKEYTYSALVYSDTDYGGAPTTPLHYHAGLSNQNQGKLTSIKYDQILVKDKWKLIYLTFKLNGDADSFRPFLYIGAGTRNVWVAYLKLEEGNRPTDWTPAPEDVTAEIAEVSSALSTFENTVNGAFKNDIIDSSEKKAIEQNIQLLNNEKSDVDKQYDVVYANSVLSGAPETNLFSAKSAYNTAHANLLSSINVAIGAGAVTAAQRTDITNKFTAYRSSIQVFTQRIQEALDFISTAKVDNIQIGGRNLIVKNTILDNTYLIETTGLTAYSSTHQATDFIQVEAGKEYVMSAPALNQVRIIYYNSSKVFISGVLYGGAQGSSKIITTPASTAFIRISAEKAAGTPLMDKWKFERGNKVTDWTASSEDIEKAYQDYANTKAALEREVAKAYADGKVSAEETRAIADATAKMNSAKAHADSLVTVHDTRNDNQPPSWYFANYPRKTVTEFKFASVLGVTGIDTYGILTTKVPWNDSSGGHVVQEFSIAGQVLTRSGNTSTWSAWKNNGAQISAAEQKVIALEAKTDYTTNVSSGTTLATGTLLVGANSSTTAGISGLGTLATDIRFWAGNTFSSRTSAPFRVQQDGTLFASQGTVGGFTLTTTALHTTNAGMHNDGTTRFWAGGTLAARDTAPFRVSSAGVLSATGASISGAITATTLTTTSGTIGAFTIGTTSLSTSNAGIHNDGTIRFWAGGTLANRASAPFRVDSAGALVSTNANISGSVTATSGAIGGFTITSTAVYTSNAGMANDGTVRFFAGSTHANRATAPFRVDSAGALFSSNANISGNITATGGTIGAFTIGATSLSTSNAGMHNDGTVRFWAGGTPVNRDNAPFRILQSGEAFMSKATIISQNGGGGVFTQNGVTTSFVGVYPGVVQQDWAPVIRMGFDTNLNRVVHEYYTVTGNFTSVLSMELRANGWQFVSGQNIPESWYTESLRLVTTTLTATDATLQTILKGSTFFKFTNFNNGDGTWKAGIYLESGTNGWRYNAGRNLESNNYLQFEQYYFASSLTPPQKPNTSSPSKLGNGIYALPFGNPFIDDFTNSGASGSTVNYTKSVTLLKIVNGVAEAPRLLSVTGTYTLPSTNKTININLYAGPNPNNNNVPYTFTLSVYVNGSLNSTYSNIDFMGQVTVPNNATLYMVLSVSGAVNVGSLKSIISNDLGWSYSSSSNITTSTKTITADAFVEVSVT